MKREEVDVVMIGLISCISFEFFFFFFIEWLTFDTIL